MTTDALAPALTGPEDKGSAIPQTTMVAMYRRMLLSRLVEERVGEMYRAGTRGLYHLSIGQEAVAVGVCFSLRKDDYVLSTHRGKGHYIAKGGDLKAFMAEFLEKTTGFARAKGGPMHVMDPEVGMLGANGIVGASIPLACGAALSAKLRRSGQVAVSFFGDGATNCGPCHESMNMAGAWKLPIVFACENNLFQTATPSAKVSGVPDFAGRAAAYGFPGYVVDGMDVGAVHAAAQQAVTRARGGQGPTLLEFKTYRFRGHSEADATRGRAYRTPEELAAWEEKCPVRQAEHLLKSRGWLGDPQLAEIRRECLQEIEDAIAFAKASPDAPAQWALTDVFAATEVTP